jgi:hypothetical protein
MSYPISCTIGHIKGVVNKRIEVESRIQPRTMRISAKMRTIPIGGIVRPSTKKLIELMIPHIESVFE